MVSVLGVVVLGCVLAGGMSSLGLGAFLRRHRGRGGASWFMGALAAQGVAALGYSVGLLVFDSFWRAFAEAWFLGVFIWIGPFFLAFALEYTGRSGVLETWAFRGVVAATAAGSALALTHPGHALLWREFRVVETLGLAGATYAIQPAGYAAILVCLAAVAVAVLLLVEAMLAYGPLYRRETIAVVLSTVPPALGFVHWITGARPWPALNFIVVLLVVHVAFDAYAFGGTHMFETNPVTRRAAERNALNDLDEPVLVLDADDRVVEANGRARAAFGVPSADGLPVAFETVTGQSLDEARETDELSTDGPSGGVFAVSYTPLTDSRGGSVGGTVILYDISGERQREQELTVLNRVLRHNLRNKMTVIRGHAQSIRADLSDDHLESQVDAIVESGDDLLAVAETAQEFRRVRERDRDSARVDLAAVVRSVREDVLADWPDARIDTAIEADDARVRTDRAVLELLLSNLVENAVAHADDNPSAVVRVRDAADGRVAVDVRDDNNRISDAELAPLRAGTETPLNHGSGVGLWVATWCADALGASLEFAYDDGNVVTVTLRDRRDEP
ncbi:histidine kinase N-terminal 7TM domain-containing protein [Salarchaeum sp. JOR-1]|uniref:sensor histidine kinase n=1 Tax=Salarchaeum sp. JOR-1 TaxID=2599399 RepID=UPI0011987DA6|nr:histidine kinase N-terminal 7TM domain-containing protein [Salarchaeum sp. JOR-1]QDX41348.1 PAS domain-containing protein [Salarchaeum sp. JOR-1]